MANNFMNRDKNGKIVVTTKHIIFQFQRLNTMRK